MPLFDFIVSVRHFYERYMCTTTIEHSFAQSMVAFFFLFSSLICFAHIFTVAAVVCRHHKSWMKIFFFFFLSLVWRTQPKPIYTQRRQKNTHIYTSKIGNMKTRRCKICCLHMILLVCICVKWWNKDVRVYVFSISPYTVCSKGETGEKLEKARNSIHNGKTESIASRTMSGWKRRGRLNCENNRVFVLKMKMDVGFSFPIKVATTSSLSIIVYQ